MRRRAIALKPRPCASQALLRLRARARGWSTTAATITMREFRFGNVKKNYEPGTYTFTIRNNGEFPHNFTIVYVAQGRSSRQATSPAESLDR